MHLRGYPCIRTSQLRRFTSVCRQGALLTNYPQIKKAPESTGAFHRSFVCARTAGLCKAALFVYGRHISTSFEHGAKVTPRKGKLAF